MLELFLVVIISIFQLFELSTTISCQYSSQHFTIIKTRQTKMRDVKISLTKISWVHTNFVKAFCHP